MKYVRAEVRRISRIVAAWSELFEMWWLVWLVWLVLRLGLLSPAANVFEPLSSHSRITLLQSREAPPGLHALRLGGLFGAEESSMWRMPEADNTQACCKATSVTQPKMSRAKFTSCGAILP